MRRLSDVLAVCYPNSMANKKLDFVVKFFDRRIRVRSTDAGIAASDAATYWPTPNPRIHIRPSVRGKAFFNWLGHEFQHASHWYADEELVERFWDEFSEIVYRPEVLARCGLQRITTEDGQ